MIKLENIAKSFQLNGKEIKVLKGVDLTIRDDDFVALMGPSGSGKSTLLGILAGIDTPSSGSIVIDNEDISKKTEDQLAVFRNRNIGIVFQAYNLISSLNAIENVKAPLFASRDSISSREMDSRAREMLDLVGLKDREKHKPSEMSGGEQQRVAIARALINNPSILIADEPTGNLDSKTGEKVLNLIEKISNEMQLTIIMATHSKDIAKLADRVINISDGIIRNEK